MHFKKIREMSATTLDFYETAEIKRIVRLPLNSLNNIVTSEELIDLLRSHISNEICNRCIPQGYVKSESCEVKSHSVGVCSGANIIFNLDIKCMICCPNEGDKLSCVAITVTQAGVRCHAPISPSPLVVYISREMDEIKNKKMDAIKPGDIVQIKVIARRFELNDKHVSVIGELI
jgi:hypothetical protein